MPTATIDDVWVYIYEQVEVRTRDLEQRFVKTREMARATMYKYKHRLEVEGKILSKPVHAKPPYHLYYVPQSLHWNVEALRYYKSLPDVIGGDVNDLLWREIPEGMALLPVKEKILWQNDDTGAMAVLQRVPEGLVETPHYHPDGNHFIYAISGAIETPSGNIENIAGTYRYVPKGTTDIGVKVVKELICIAYWDGPRTKVNVPYTSSYDSPHKIFHSYNKTNNLSNYT
jgi:hypothetical protein